MRLERRVKKELPGYLDPEVIERCTARGEARLLARVKAQRKKDEEK